MEDALEGPADVAPAAPAHPVVLGRVRADAGPSRGRDWIAHTPRVVGSLEPGASRPGEAVRRPRDPRIFWLSAVIMLLALLVLLLLLAYAGGAGSSTGLRGYLDGAGRGPPVHSALRLAAAPPTTTSATTVIPSVTPPERPYDTIPAGLAARLRSGGFDAVALDSHAPATEPSVEPPGVEPIGAAAAQAAAAELGRGTSARGVEEGPALVAKRDLGKPDDFAAGDVFRGHTVERFFAAGGMSLLYEAQALEPARHDPARAKRLIKLLKPSFRTERFRRIQERLLAEGQLLRALAGEFRFLVPVHDVGVDERVGPYVVMDKVPGQSLYDRLLLARAANRPIAIETVVRLGISVGAGLQLLHLQGVVHRDLKPGNLLLPHDPRGAGRSGSSQRSHSDGYADVMIIDFGTSKSFYSPVTSTQDLTFGTAAYCAPEQIRNDDVISGNTDQYALGHILYECIANRHRFADANGDTPAAEVLIRRHIVPVPWKPPEHVVPPRLWAILERAMAFEYTDRYPSCGALVKALRAWLAAPETVPKPPAALVVEVRPTIPKDTRTNGARPEALLPATPPEPAKRLELSELSERASLVVRSGQHQGARFEIHERTVIGRHPAFAAIVLEDEGISRQHAVLHMVVPDPERPVFNVRDRSRNGTSVGGLTLRSEDDPDAPPSEVLAPLRVGESMFCHDVELRLYPAGRLLPNGTWQPLAEARENEARRDAALREAALEEAALQDAALRKQAQHATAEPAAQAPAPEKHAPSVPQQATPQPAVPKKATPKPVTQKPAHVPARIEVGLGELWFAPTLLVIVDGRPPRRYLLGKRGVIGSAPELANIVIDDPRVSKKHVSYCHITGAEPSEITYAFTDELSTNGTFSVDRASRRLTPITTGVLHAMESIALGHAVVEIVLLAPGMFRGVQDFQAYDAAGRPIPRETARAPARWTSFFANLVLIVLSALVVFLAGWLALSYFGAR